LKLIWNRNSLSPCFLTSWSKNEWRRFGVRVHLFFR